MFIHAKTVETRWGQALAFIDETEEGDDCLAIQLWAPVAEGGALAKVRVSIAIPATSDEMADKVFDAWSQAVADITGKRVEDAITKASATIVRMLDESFERHPMPA